jgi:hypothetical protein
MGDNVAFALLLCATSALLGAMLFLATGNAPPPRPSARYAATYPSAIVTLAVEVVSSL